MDSRHTRQYVLCSCVLSQWHFAVLQLVFFWPNVIANIQKYIKKRFWIARLDGRIFLQFAAYFHVQCILATTTYRKSFNWTSSSSVLVVKPKQSNSSVMSFGGGSNPPWQRNSLGNAGQQNAIPSLQSQMINPNLVGFPNFNQNLAMVQHQNATAVAAQNNLALLPQLSGNNIGENSMLNEKVQHSNTPPAMGH